MKKRKHLIELYPNWFNGDGIFADLQQLDVPWKEQNISNYLDIEYYGNHSGEKNISPLLSKMIKENPLTAEERAILSNIIYNTYKYTWQKEWNTYLLEYNPIENYSMVENMTNDKTETNYGKVNTREDNLIQSKTGNDTETPDTTNTRIDDLTHKKSGQDTLKVDGKDTRTDDLQHSKSGNDVVTPEITDTTTPDITTTGDNKIYGFNSTTAVDLNLNSATQTGTNTNVRTGSETTAYDTTLSDTGTQTSITDDTNITTYDNILTDSGQQTITLTGTNTMSYDTTLSNTGTQSYKDSGTDTRIHTYNLTRSGNIGVTTSQQMLQAERELWEWNFFEQVVYPDIDRILTIQIY